MFSEQALFNYLNLLAEREGFEPPDPRGSTVFKTAAFDHSATSPAGAKHTGWQRLSHAGHLVPDAAMGTAVSAPEQPPPGKFPHDS